MEMNQTSNRIHPLMAGAAVSVILVSLAGIAAITGVLPNSHSHRGANHRSANGAGDRTGSRCRTDSCARAARRESSCGGSGRPR